MAETIVFLTPDDIDFADDCLRIKPGRIKQILKPIPYKGAMSSLNAIKDAYFQKHYNKAFKLVFTDNHLDKPASKAWYEINDLIEKAIEIIDKTMVPAPIALKPRSVKAATRLKPSKGTVQPKEKPDYLRYLAGKQSPRYKLITIKEDYGGKKEESHIYRFDTLSGRVLIVWENTIAASRATYLFIADERNMPERIARIEAFIHQGDLLFKRSRFKKLRENKALRQSLGYVESVKHETLLQYKRDIQTYLSRY